MMLTSSRARFLAWPAAATIAVVTLDAASTTFWQVSTQAEFLKGTVEQASIDSDGRLTLGPALEVVHDAAAPAIWDLALGSNGTLWAGTGNDGKVWRVEPGGKSAVALDAAELEVHAVAASSDGGAFAATSPEGKVYKIARDGATSTFFDPEDKYIWSLVAGRDGSLYVGAGEKGRIYKVTPDGRGTLFLDAEATHVTALIWDSKGALLVGTASPARVVRVDESGRPFVLLESNYKEIRGLRVAPDGRIYATAIGGSSTPTEPAPKPVEPTPPVSIPTISAEITVSAVGETTVVTPSTASPPEPRAAVQNGAVYRIAPDGEWVTLWESADDMPYDIVIEPSGALLVATGGKGKIYRLSGNPIVTTLVTRAEAQQVTALGQDHEGRLVLATSNPGKIVRVTANQATRGTYTSDVKDTVTVATWGALRWRAVAPTGTSVELFTRSGNTRTPDKTWSDWSRAYRSAAGEVIESPKARYLQWKAVLTGTGTASPVLTSVTAAYLPRNTRPVIDAITVHPPGVVFQRPFPTGEPELAGFEGNTADGRPLASASVASGAPALGRRSFQKSLQTFVWRASDSDSDRLQFDVLYRLEGDTNWRVLKRGLWDEIYTWDTTSVPDGTYVIKVAASDSPSNPPATALTGERESGTFDIDNTPPAIEVPRDRKTAPNVVVFTVRDSHSPIQRVEYSQNAGRWRFAFPVDGLLDSRVEHFELQLEDDSTGAVVLRVIDTLGNVATAVIGR